MKHANTEKPSLNSTHNIHNEVWQLLPWHVNNSLNKIENKKVKSHLKACTICQQEIVRIKQLVDLVANKSYEATSEAVIDANFSILKNRINSHTETPKAHNKITTHSQKIFGFRLGKLTQLSLPSPALAMAATVLISLLMPRLEFNSPEEITFAQFKTLSNSEIAAVKKNTVRVIFLDDTQKTDINNLLAFVNGHITSGPTEQGEYSIGIDAELTIDNVQSVIDNLKKNSNVLFAEPAYTTLITEDNCEC